MQYELREDTSYNIELWSNEVYRNCYSSLDDAMEAITPELDEGDTVGITYKSNDTELFFIDEHLEWRGH